MGDIFEDVTNEVVTFTAETERGRDWMIQHYHEATHRYAINQPIERAEAARFKKEAAAAGLVVYGLLSS